MKRLAALAPELDIFSTAYVLRDSSGWQITEKGREFLILIEARAAESAPAVAFAPPAVSDVTNFLPNVVQLVGHKLRRRRRRAAA